MAESEHQSEQRRPIPWPLVAASLTAMGLLYDTASEIRGVPWLPLLLALAMLLIASRMFETRLSGGRSPGWVLRAVVFTLITLLVGIPDENVAFWYLNPAYTNLLGCLLAAELVIRAWERAPGDQGVILLLSGLVVAAGSDTARKSVIQFLSPLYVVFVMLSVRSFFRTGRSRAVSRMMRFTVGAITLVLGFILVQTVLKVDRELQYIAAGLFHQHSPTGSDIGLSIAPRLQAVFNPEPSMERILVIHGPAKERYLRALAFDDLESNQWRPSFSNRHFDPVAMADLRPQQAGTMLRFRIVGDTYDLLPLPLNTAGIASTGSIQRDQWGTMQFYAGGGDARYEAVIPDQEQFDGPICIPLDAESRARALKIPKSLDPKVSELAISVAGTGDPLSRVYHIANYLRTNHGYSLIYFPKTTGDALSEFILGKKDAHCEYFASALVAMARAAGVPARFVTGYYAHESAKPDYMVVRDRDAHAWAECWIDGRGWTTVDATPSGGMPDARFGDPSELRRAWESVADFPAAVREWMGGLSRSVVLSTIFVSVAIALVVQLIQGRKRSRVAKEPPYAKPKSMELIVIGSRFNKWLKTQGAICPPNRTWRESVDPLVLPSECGQFLNTYDEARFGGANGDTIVRLNRLLENLESKTGSMKHG